MNKELIAIAEKPRVAFWVVFSGHFRKSNLTNRPTPSVAIRSLYTLCPIKTHQHCFSNIFYES